MTGETSALTPVRTKTQRSQLPGDQIPRNRLVDRLSAGSSWKLTLISAQPGTGKTTLVAQWLNECPQASAWLSLDEHDNALIVFVSYLIGAIRTVIPGACEKTSDLLSAAQTRLLRDHLRPGRHAAGDRILGNALYDLEGYFHDNPLDRYTLNSYMLERGKLHTEVGKLVIYVQHDEPADPKQRQNWLPAPEGGFRFAARFYGPYTPLIDGSYNMPGVVRVD